MRIEIEAEDWITAKRESWEFKTALANKLLSKYQDVDETIGNLVDAVVHLAQILAEHNLLDPQIFYDSL